MTDPPRFLPPGTSSTETNDRHYFERDVETVQFVGGGVLARSPFVWIELGSANDSRPVDTSASEVVFQVIGPPNPNTPVRDLIKRAEELRALPLLGRPAPTTIAKLVASSVLPETVNHIVPDRVATTGDGGIMFYFLGRGELTGRRYASLEIHEGGELVMLRSDRESGSLPQVEEVSLGRSAIRGALRDIQSFIDPAWLDQ